MKKLKLDLDALQVETFEAERTPEPRGTVHGQFTSAPFACPAGCELPFSVECDSAFECSSELCSGGECNSALGC